MSLTYFVTRPEVKARIKPLRPQPPRRIDTPLRVPVRTSHPRLVGTAFDYLLRFELQRRAPHAVAARWVAEHAPDCYWQPNFFADLWVNPHEVSLEVAEEAAKKEAERARGVLDRAKAAHASYLKRKRPTPSAREDLAAHALRLAKLDVVYRAGISWWARGEMYNSGQPDLSRPELAWEEADPEDVKDLLALLAVVPFDDLLDDQVMLLNPNFGETSERVGGADADLIAGDMLIDFKTTKESEAKVEYVDQLLGYLLLARHRRRAEPTFPEVKRFGLYFSRHGHLWVRDASFWTSHPDFPELERWFFKHAKEVFRRPLNRSGKKSGASPALARPAPVQQRSRTPVS
jgi:hypothetical protein